MEFVTNGIWMNTWIFMSTTACQFNTLKLKQNGRYFADNIFKSIFLNENVWIFLKIAPKIVPTVWIKNIAALVKIMARHQPHAKPFEPMMVSLLMHICIIRPQWVNINSHDKHKTVVETLKSISQGFLYYCKTSNISRTFVGNKIVDNSDAPTTSSFST